MYSTKNLSTITALALTMLSMAACGPQSETAAPSAAPTKDATPAVVVVQEAEICHSCGTVSSINAVREPGAGTGIGAVLGGLAGGVAGNQVGGGSGKKIATVAGVIGGAVIGNKIEANKNASSYYQITVDMDDGSLRIITVPDAFGIGIGSPVTVTGNDIALR